MEELEDIPGVGSATSEKLRDAGYSTIDSIAVASPDELSEEADLGDSTASKIVRAARDESDVGGFETGAEVADRRQNISKLKTLVAEVDELLGGGVETQSITEIYGEFGSGKSQLTHQLSVNVQLPEEVGGLNGRAVFIDTEDTFRPERIEQMIKGLDDEILEKVKDKKEIEDEDELLESFLEKIQRAHAYNSDQQMLLVDEAKEIADEYRETDTPVKLFIVDSLTSHFRAEYVGRGNLADRQQKLNKHVHDLLRLAELHNAAVVVTNQVQEDPDKMFGDPTKPIGGHVLGHNSTYRLYLRKSKENKRIIRLVDAPSLPDGEAVLRVEEEGLKPE